MLLGSVGLAQSSVQPTLGQLQDLRRVLSLYEDVETAKADGYEQFLECMSSPQGAQGIHFLKGALVDEQLDVLQPELLLYEPRPDGSLRLVAAEVRGVPEGVARGGARARALNTTLLDAPFYGLHAWVWQHNPLGFFANWNPLVACGCRWREAFGATQLGGARASLRDRRAAGTT